MKEQATTPALSPTRRAWRLFRRVVVLALVITFCWYGFGRAVAPLRAVRIVSPGQLAAVDADAGAARSPGVGESTEGPTGAPTAPPVRPLRAGGGIPSTIRLVTWNIAHGRGLHESNFTGETRDERLARLAAIARTLKELSVDIVILNEADFDCSWSHRINQAKVIAAEAGYPWRAEQRNFDASIPFFALRFGNAVLSRWPIRHVERIDHPAARWWEPALAGWKRGLLCTVDVPGLGRLNVVAAHFDQSAMEEDTRIASAESIRQRLKRDSHPAIIGGDFNTAPPGFPRVVAKRLERTALSVFTEDGAFHTLPLAEPAPEDATYPAPDPKRVIDWILVPSGWRIISRRVVVTDLSDHALVVMEVEVGRGGG